jgi:hypothetical protein
MRWRVLYFSVGFLEGPLNHIGGSVKPARFRNNLFEILGSFRITAIRKHLLD